MINNKKNNQSWEMEYESTFEKKPPSKLDEIFFETIIEQRRIIIFKEEMKRLTTDEEIDHAVKEWESQDTWRELCSEEQLNLGKALDDEVYWSLYGMDFAYVRLSLLFYKSFDKVIDQKIGFAESFILDQVSELGTDEMREYRSVLIFYSIQELYFWMGAVWDRMAQFLNLFAFNIKNINKNRDVWRNSFQSFKDNYGDKDILVNDEDYKIIERLTNKVYQKIWNRRNILAHKGSLLGRVKAKMAENPEVRDLYEKFLLGSEKWEPSNIMSESREFKNNCYDAAMALKMFMGTFLKWKKSQMYEGKKKNVN